MAPLSPPNSEGAAAACSPVGESEVEPLPSGLVASADSVFANACRALRLWFCGTLGVFILLMILAREVLFAGAPWLEFTQSLATAIIATGTNMILLRFRPGILDPVQREQAAFL